MGLEEELALKESQAKNLKDILAIRSAVCQIKNTQLDPPLLRLAETFGKAKMGETVADEAMAAAIGVDDPALIKTAQDIWAKGAEASELLNAKIVALDEAKI
jgi:hypothetical protein